MAKISKHAISKMREHELEKMLKYFQTRLIKRDELLIEELRQMDAYKQTAKISGLNHGSNELDGRVIDNCLRALSTWNNETFEDGKWRELADKQEYVDTWVNRYISKKAWGRYLNSVRVSRASRLSTSKADNTSAVKVTSPRNQTYFEGKLKSLSKEFGTSMPETRGIAMELGVELLELFLAEAKEEEHRDIRTVIISKNLKEMTLDEEKQARIKLGVYIGSVVDSARNNIADFNDDKKGRALSSHDR
ncbi:TPA: hypothetical protein ACGUPI_003204 [Vibrio vulnificus]